MSRRVRAWAPALIWAVVLFLFSSQPTVSADLSGGLDKVAHFGAFAILGILLAYAATEPRIAIAWPICVGLTYAATDELHQAFVPGRNPDAADWLADALGVVVGCILVYRIRDGRSAPGRDNPRNPVDSANR